MGKTCEKNEGWMTGSWFGTFFIFPYIGNNHPNWLEFFRGVQTTNQMNYGGSISSNFRAFQVISLMIYHEWWLIVPKKSVPVVAVLPDQLGHHCVNWWLSIQTCPRNSCPVDGPLNILNSSEKQLPHVASRSSKHRWQRFFFLSATLSPVSFGKKWPGGSTQRIQRFFYRSNPWGRYISQHGMVPRFPHF